MDFSKFDEMLDMETLKQDIEDARENGGEYRQVPSGEYEVKISKMGLTESKLGKPMVNIWFKISAGEFANSMIFMNQVITQGFQIHIMNEFLRSCDPSHEISFENYPQYNTQLADIFANVSNSEYALDYDNEGKFPKFEITKIFE